MRAKLTQKTVDQTVVAKGKNSQRLFDGGGLYLDVRRSENKTWEYRYTKSNCKGTFLGLGTYPEISLESARKRRWSLVRCGAKLPTQQRRYVFKD
ncbi:Arm DNA-binding domain-containing protein [Vibrio astriarenae]|uniref:Arm DNA-binding domain-containing protein n=1 Tax=Vibrio astriarenae TaxID=1481923 RepID=UPI00373516B9